MDKSIAGQVLAQANSGKASAPFLVIVTALVCLLGFLMFNVIQDELQQRRVEQAEHDQTYGTNYVPSAAEQKRRAHNAAFESMRAAIQAKDRGTFTDAFTDLKTNFPSDWSRRDSLQGFHSVQALLSDAIKVDFEFAVTQLVAFEPVCGPKITHSTSAWREAGISPSENYLRMLLDAKCGIQDVDDQNVLIDHLKNSRHPALVLAQEKDPVRKAALVDPMLYRAVSDVRIKDALLLIGEGADPNYRPNGNRDSILDHVLSSRSHKDLEPVAIALLDAGAHPAPKYGNNRSKYLIHQAIENGSALVVAKILEKDPDQIKTGNLSVRIIRELSEDATFPVAMLESLVANGLAFDAEHEKAAILNLRAVRKGNLEVVRFLLEYGVDANYLYVVTTLLGEANASNHESAEDLVALLNDHGATDDVLAQARKLRGTAQCNRIPKSEIPGIEELKTRFSEGQSGVIVKPTIDGPEACGVVISHCRDQGLGFDDCVASSTACSDDFQGTQLCCPSAVADMYFAARCAGLTVQESIYWLDYFPKIYGTPGVLSQ